MNISDRLSPETKALILINEYYLGKLPLPVIREVFEALTDSELERTGLISLIQDKGELFGLTKGQLISLIDGIKPKCETNQTQSTDRSKTPTLAILHGDSKMPPPPPPPPQRVPTSDPEEKKETSSFQVQSPSSPAVASTATTQLPGSTPPPGMFQVKRPEASPPSPAPQTPASPPSQEDFARASFGSGAFEKAASKRILIADDDARIRMVYRKKLTDLHYLVDEADDGSKAWDMLQAQKYKLVILDMKMPGMHGLEVLSRLTKEPKKPAVIISSAYDQLKDDFTVSTYPNLAYLTKPVNINTLVSTVEDLMNR